MNKALKNAGISEKYFDTGEIKLNYVSSPPKGIPIVFIPGQAATWEEYSLLLLIAITYCPFLFLSSFLKYLL